MPNLKKTLVEKFEEAAKKPVPFESYDPPSPPSSSVGNPDRHCKAPEHKAEPVDQLKRGRK